MHFWVKQDVIWVASYKVPPWHYFCIVLFFFYPSVLMDLFFVFKDFALFLLVLFHSFFLWWLKVLYCFWWFCFALSLVVLFRKVSFAFWFFFFLLLWKMFCSLVLFFDGLILLCFDLISCWFLVWFVLVCFWLACFCFETHYINLVTWKWCPIMKDLCNVVPKNCIKSAN